MTEYSRAEFERDRFGPRGDELARRPLSNCWYCSRPGEVFCSTKVTESVICIGAEVRVGDFVQRNYDLLFYRVERIHEHAKLDPGDRMRIWSPDWPRRTFCLDVAGVIHEQEHTLYLPLLRMETRACGLPVCERHYREIDEGKQMCVKHWDVEKVYGTN